MDNLTNLTTYTASQARTNLYTLIKQAANGKKNYEIRLRGSEPVILISKSELESWLETQDILNSPEEMKAIRAGQKSKVTIPYEKVLQDLGLNLNNEDWVTPTRN